MNQKFYDKTVAIVQSTRFFYATLVLFVLETSWIALSGLYSMAYDESTHLGIIRLYAANHRWLPFWSHQPAGADTFGALARDPSYLYRFLMSFPYRLLGLFTPSQTWQVLMLRFFSIFFFAVGIVVFRRLLLRTGASRALVHTVLGLFILTPIVPLLAAQVNYDNLLFPLVGLTFYLALNVTDAIKHQHIDVKNLLLLTILGLFTSLVTYAYLPIFFAVMVWVLMLLVAYARRAGVNKVYKQGLRSFTSINMGKRVGLVVGMLLGVVLFLQAYGVSVAHYKTPTPRCDQVLSVNECFGYGPYRRDYLSHQDLLDGALVPAHTDPANYLVSWLEGISYQPMFALNGEQSQFIIGAPLFLPRVLEWVIGISGLVLIIRWQQQLRRQYKLNLLLVVSLFYIVVLFIQGYTAFLYDGFPVAIQARYLVIILPILYLFLALAFGRALRAWPYLKAMLAVLALGILLLQGGGAMVFIMRSDASWYWPNQTVRDMNQFAQKVFDHIVIQW